MKRPTTKEFLQRLDERGACPEAVVELGRTLCRERQSLEKGLERIRRRLVRELARLTPDEFVPVSEMESRASTMARHARWLMNEIYVRWADEPKKLDTLYRDLYHAGGLCTFLRKLKVQSLVRKVMA